MWEYPNDSSAHPAPARPRALIRTVQMPPSPDMIERTGNATLINLDNDGNNNSHLPTNHYNRQTNKQTLFMFHCARGLFHLHLGWTLVVPSSHHQGVNGPRRLQCLLRRRSHWESLGFGRALHLLPGEIGHMEEKWTATNKINKYTYIYIYVYICLEKVPSPATDSSHLPGSKPKRKRLSSNSIQFQGIC